MEETSRGSSLHFVGKWQWCKHHFVLPLTEKLITGGETGFCRPRADPVTANLTRGKVGQDVEGYDGPSLDVTGCPRLGLTRSLLCSQQIKQRKEEQLEPTATREMGSVLN